MSYEVDRRTVLIAAATVAGGAAVSMGMSKTAAAAARIRFSTSSEAGKNALLQYRTGVALMKQRSASDFFDPTGWAYQALIHGILMRWPKADFINFVFGEAPPDHPQRLLAEACWATCPHGAIDFLPWHRIYVYYFERIVRKAVLEATGEADFTLPYWDYSRGGEHAVIPAALREAVDGSPLGNALFDTARDARMNGLFAPATALPDEDVVLDALKQPLFGTDTSGGFSAALEQTPHGNVHVTVGGSDEFGFPVGDMSSPTTAGRDPVFWLHHANMDRLWESWLRMGNETTATYSDQGWYSKKWPFVDEDGDRQDISLADFNALTQSELISYDRLEQIPRSQLLLLASTPPVVATAEASAPVVLSPKGNRIALGSTEPTLHALSANQPVKTALVVIDGVSTDAELAVVFDVFLNLPQGGGPSDARHIGSFNFFGTVMDGMSHSMRLVFDITEQVRAATAAGTWPSNPTVTILPRGNFAGQHARIGRVRFVVE